MTSSSPASTTPQLWVYCLCAQWCGTCREYRAAFQTVAQAARERWGDRIHCVWVDVEDEADLVDPIDVEDFPTLLIASGGQARGAGGVELNPPPAASPGCAH